MPGTSSCAELVSCIEQRLKPSKKKSGQMGNKQKPVAKKVRRFFLAGPIQFLWFDMNIDCFRPCVLPILQVKTKLFVYFPVDM